MLVTFRLIVFRPFIGEVLSGKVLSQSPLGIRVSMGFFDDITIVCP
jgi:DNA-directed RNA polymerase III subunit RPC8